MQSIPKKLQKLRTFQSDLAAAQGPVPAPTPVSVPPPQDTKNQLPPVLNKREPGPQLPPLQAPAPIPSPVAVATEVVPKPASAPAIATSLQAQVDTVFHMPGRPGEVAVTKPAIKVAESLIQARPVTPAIAREPVRVMDTVGNEGLSGTVITNQKRGRFKLLPSIWEALQQWFKDTERSLEKRAEKKRLAIPTVRTIEDRKETIKKAGSVGALAPKDDYSKLAAKLPPKPKPDAVATPIVVIADKKAVPAPSWSHFEGSEQRLVPEPEPITPPPLPQPEPVVPAIPPPPKVEIPKPIEEPKIAPPIPTPPPLPPPPVVSEAVIEPAPTKAMPTRERAVEPVRLDIGKITRSPVSKAVPRTGRNFKWLFYIGVATTAVVAAVGGASLVTWLLGEGSAPVVPVAVTNLPSSFVTPVPQSSTMKIPLPRTRAEWYDSVSRVDQGELTTIMPTINIGGAERPATTDETLAMLALRTEPALTRSIKEITFMLVDNQPAIVLKVSAYDSTFGGLLLSESVLSAELAPLFGESVTATYKVGVGTVPPEFIDELSDNNDVRVLKDEMENERLVYGFVDQNTVIITTDKETFSSLASRLR